MGIMRNASKGAHTLFFFRGTFHNIFKLNTQYLFLHRYQWKKLPKAGVPLTHFAAKFARN